MDSIPWCEVSVSPGPGMIGAGVEAGDLDDPEPENQAVLRRVVAAATRKHSTAEKLSEC